jgi:putative aldouronate transport system permease protein
MVTRKSPGERVFGAVSLSLLGLLTLVFFYPMYYCAVASFSDPTRLLMHRGIMLAPLGFSLAGYEAVFSNQNILTGYANTLLYVLCGTLSGVLLTVLGGYCLSRKNLMLRKVLALLIILTMYIDAGIIPQFLLVRSLGLYDTRWAVLLPDILNTYNLIVMRTAFAAIPMELEESAMLDGAGDLRILWSILIPVVKATLAVITLFVVVAWWNAWFNASIYIRDRSKYPLQLFLREILIASTTDGNDGTSVDGMYRLEALIKYCSVIVSTVPILCAYPFAQKYFVKGVMIGSVKG